MNNGDTNVPVIDILRAVGTPWRLNTYLTNNVPSRVVGVAMSVTTLSALMLTSASAARWRHRTQPIRKPSGTSDAKSRSRSLREYRMTAFNG